MITVFLLEWISQATCVLLEAMFHLTWFVDLQVLWRWRHVWIHASPTMCHQWLRSSNDWISCLGNYKDIGLAEGISVSQGQRGVLVLWLLVLSCLHSLHIHGGMKTSRCEPRKQLTDQERWAVLIKSKALVKDQCSSDVVTPASQQDITWNTVEYTNSPRDYGKLSAQKLFWEGDCTDLSC